MTIAELLEIKVDRIGDKPFVCFQDQIIDYSTFKINVNKAANMFKMFNIKKGDKVCLLLQNCLEFLYLWFGLAKIGAVTVPLNIQLQEHVLKYVIKQCDAKVIVVDENRLGQYLMDIKQKIFLLHGDTDDPPDGFISLKNLMNSSEDKDVSNIRIKGEDPLAILYGGGRDGLPQGSVHNHLNYINSGKVWVENIIEYREDDVFLTTLPLYSPNAQMLTVMGSLWSGQSFVFDEKLSVKHFWKEIQHHSITVFNYTLPMLMTLLEQPQNDHDLDNPVRIASGGRIPEHILDNFEKRFNTRILAGYGHAETSGFCLCNRQNNIKKNSVGMSTPHHDVRIQDDKNREMPIGQIGELCVKGKIPHSMFLEYYKLIDKTEEAWEGEWFKTGDAAYRDVEGYFYYVGQIRNCVRRDGALIPTTELELEVNQHPRVSWTTIEVNSADLDSNFKINIHVCPKENENLEIKDIIEFCKERLPYFADHICVEIVNENRRVFERKNARLNIMKAQQ